MKPETVILLNKVYCWVRAAGWLVMGLMCFWARGNIPAIYETSGEMFRSAGIEQGQLVAIYGLIGFLGVFLSICNLVLANAPMTKKWWTAHLINHVVGVLECCCVPLALPLVFLWFRADVKAMFDVPVTPTEPYIGD